MPRPMTRLKVESCRSLDVRRLAREGLLDPNVMGSAEWVWRDDYGNQTASVGIAASSGTLRLRYAIGGLDASQVVSVERTACALGGDRPWFKCPACGHRCALLHLRRGRFACRKCQGLAYLSQAIDPVQRIWRKQAKLERLLGEVGDKPKGMHWTTYDAIVESINACEDRRSVLLFAMLNRLGFTMDDPFG
ncbi:hypothetical protein EIP75_02155 [Aquabacterium soli]|uniref:Transposase zinc-ribbon domain-containing protein n=1 Tax=Aquabacterium soli TaxID=2493092 RepID=A0A3R8YRP7_9BURK|nr:hypothetical protein [Aquabacterium soli]RRS06407.1 hypothetical protein EIP75_02155 [Aquabacterium soli]